MKNTFNFIEPAYQLRINNRLERHSVKSVRYGTETISHLGPEILNLLPEEYKEIDSLSIFKIKTSNWETDECELCQLCKTCIQPLDFIYMCIYLPITLCMHEVYKSRFSLFFLIFELQLNIRLFSFMILN